MDILLDTSFLMSVMQGKIDIMPELRKFGKPKLFVLDLVIKELESLSSAGGQDGTAARLALTFLKREAVEVIEAGKGHTDRKIVEYSMDRDMVVCTIDKELKDRLLMGGMEVITIRQGKYFVRAE